MVENLGYMNDVCHFVLVWVYGYVQWKKAVVLKMVWFLWCLSVCLSIDPSNQCCETIGMVCYVDGVD